MRLNQFGLRLPLAFAFAAVIPAFLAAPRASASPPAQTSATAAADQNDFQIGADLAQEYNKDRFKNVQFDVKDGVVTLKGSVALFADKEAAEKKASRAKKALAIRNQISVTGALMSDKELQEKLVKKLEYDRVGYGTTAFNAISVSVRDGIVTLAGHAYGPVDKSSALAVASLTPGVLDVIDDIEVDPVSGMDDRIRLDVARRVYGHPALARYAIDPGKPIRISVQGGKVTLYGEVQSQSDRDIAYLQANSAPGVFKVTNELQVSGAASELN
jgi:hyperosmotically inducible periplasmic protein